jgi:hypothetical protein
MPTPSLILVPARFKTGKLYTPVATTSGGLVLGASGDFNVTRATTATRVNANGLIESVASGIPRLDYPIGGGCPALLVEPSAVNYLLRSEEFDNAAWSKNATGLNTSIGTNGIQANVAISPDGTQNADRVNFLLQPDADLGLTQNYAAATSGQTYNMSIWVKGEGANIGKQIKVQIKRTSGGTFVGTIATITLTSGWVRFTTSAITLGASNSGVFVAITSNDATNALIWGAQLEQGTVATSYIPTTAAAVTRNADVITLSGAVSGCIGQTEGTIYAEVDLRNTSSGKRIFLLSDGTTQNEIRVTSSATNAGDLQFAVRLAGTLIVNAFSPTNVYSNGVFKIAAVYKSTDYALYVNGLQVLTSNAAGSIPACNRVDIGSQLGTSNLLNDRIRAAALYTTRLTNAELAALTTL